jgi:D-alanyl-D-alanine carboxypeptidase
MIQKSRGIVLLIAVVALLVVVSSRTSSGGGAVPAGPAKVTDDPVPSTEVQQTPPPAVETPPPEKTPGIREQLPGVSPPAWNLKLVNNSYVLSSSFAPNVTEIGGGQYFDSRAVEALQDMIGAAEDAGYTVAVRNAYRPYSTQAYIFFGKASQIQWGTDMEMIEAEERARKIVAYPGTSEHQLGLAADLMDSADSEMAAERAARLPLLKWLTAHCAEYGFILRYPKDKQELTGWYEPWHFRYVGVECAEYIMENNLCLEEFIARFSAQ